MDGQTALEVRIYQRLSRAVSDFEWLYTGGTPFFDNLDEYASRIFPEDHIKWFMEKYTEPRPLIVCSGRYGNSLKTHERWTIVVDQPFLWVPGGLRHEDLAPFPMKLTDKEYVFLDDSCYRGRTRDKIRQRIEQAGGTLINSMVLYDSSVKSLPNFDVIYRYHK